jgi:threonine/homoserine/homoserine lactone efflux protein
VLSDLPIVLLVLLILAQLPTPFLQALRLAGGLFLLYLAFGAFRACRRHTDSPAPSPASASQTVARAVLVNLVNPAPYLGWTLVLGPLLLKGRREAPAHGVALVVAFYSVMVLTNAAVIGLFGAARRLAPGMARVLLALSAIALAGFGALQLWSGARVLLHPSPDPAMRAPTLSTIAPPRAALFALDPAVRS